MTSSSEPFSVWLMPQVEDYVLTAAIIAELSEKNATVKFEPHVTVYSGSCDKRDFLKQVLTDTLAGVGPILLEIDGVRASEEFLKTVYIEFRENSVLSDLSRKIKYCLQQDSGYILRPHLSLMYKDLEIEKNWKIARGIKIKKSEMVFDEVKLASPGNSALGWRDVAKWEIWFDHKLTSFRSDEEKIRSNKNWRK